MKKKSEEKSDAKPAENSASLVQTDAKINTEESRKAKQTTNTSA